MINLKNKKGQEATTNEVKGFIIGGLVLAIVITGFVLVMIYGPGAFYKYLPDFGNKTMIVKDVEKLRYDILKDKVQYYDGDKWRDFKGSEVTLNDKEIGYDWIRQTFVEYYFDSSREKKELVTDSKEGQFITIDKSLLQKDDVIEGNKAKTGDVVIELQGQRESFNGYIGIYLLSADNKLEFYPAQKIPYTNVDASVEGEKGRFLSRLGIWARNLVYKSKTKDIRSVETKNKNEAIKNLAIDWRDSVLKKPMTISYTKDGSDAPESMRVCVDGEVTKGYLNVNLEEEVYSDNACKKTS